MAELESTLRVKPSVLVTPALSAVMLLGVVAVSEGVARLPPVSRRLHPEVTAGRNR